VAGRRKVFEEVMRKAHSFAWDKKWPKAIEEYRKALAEFPQDQAALVGLGQAYLETEQFVEALPVYEKIVQLYPDDYTALSRLAEVYAHVGQMSEAAATYLSAGDAYLRQGLTERAIECWQHAVKAETDQIEPHKRLVSIYLQQKQKTAAIKEYLALAGIYQRRGQVEKAVQQCREALRMDPHNTEARSMLETLRAGGSVVEIAPLLEAEERGGGPAQTTRELALTELAAMIFEEGPTGPPGLARLALSKSELNATINLAIDSETRGAVDKAIASYNKLQEVGVNHPAVFFNLGLLYRDKGHLDEAILALGRALADANYALGAHFALGECYHTQGKIDSALEHFIEVLKVLDLEAISKDQVDELLRWYQNLKDSLCARNNQERALAFINSLVDFFSSAAWEKKAAEARRRINALPSDGLTFTLADILEVPDAEAILGSLSLSQEYMGRNMLLTAAEECFRAIEMAPTYLPLHLCLAAIFLRQDRTEEAITKFLAVADVYRMRGDISRATSVYKRVLRLAPMDLQARARLIDLLVKDDQIEEALEQYLLLANAYYQLAQVDKALEKYNEALHFAQRSDSAMQWQVNILHKMGDAYLQRVDWRQATKAYEAIVTIAPADEKAWQTLIDLYNKQDQPRKSIAALDRLLEQYKGQGKHHEILTALEEMVQAYPREMALRERLGRAYAEQGMRKQAIAEFDVLGEMQLEAGMRQQAVQTIQLILRLGPDDPQAYRQLLAQITRR
jgi:tetratricopeptide (TPR) repeat protein